MENRVNRQKRSTNFKRVGLVSALAAVMLLVLAACGTANTTGSGTGAGAGQGQAATATATTDTVIGAATTEPAVTPGAGDDAEDADDANEPGDMDGMDDMEGMEDDDTGTAVPNATTAPAQTATPSGSTGSGSQAVVGTEVQATIREWAIDLSTQEVAAGTVTFVVNNQGQFAHNLTVTGSSGTIAKTSTFRGSEGPQTLEVELQPGTYTLICDLPGHAAMGQSIQLVVK